MKNGKYNIGNIFKNNQGCEFEIIERIDNFKRKIKFLDDFNYIKIVVLENIRSGNIRNLYYKSVYGTGYFGEGKYKAKIKGVIQKEYDCWVRILDRCYNENSNHKNPSYRNITVCAEWHNYQIFAEWYNKNKPCIEDIKFEVDKDLIQLKCKNKIYSPSTCIFLPKKINTFLCNNQVNNNSGCAGVSFFKNNNKWRAYTSEFGKNKQVSLGHYFTKEEAFNAYKCGRELQAIKAREYLRSLNYLPEEIIQLIK